MKTINLLMAFLLLLAGCAKDSGSSEVLGDTAAKLGEIRSGRMEMKLMLSGKGQTSVVTGFELKGPFDIGTDTPLPKARIEYTKTAGDAKESAVFISTGTETFVETNGQAYELDKKAFPVMEDGQSGPLKELRIDRWIKSSRSSKGPSIDGVETIRIEAALDIVAAMNDLLRLSRRTGLDAPEPLAGAEADRLRKATRSATMIILTGRDDHLLRKLEIDTQFGLDVPQELGAFAGKLVESNATLTLSITDPNGEVQVVRPENARPYRDFGRNP